MNVADPHVPFALVGDTLRQARRAVRITSSPASTSLPPDTSVDREGLYAPLASSSGARHRRVFGPSGNANNVNYGEESDSVVASGQLERIGDSVAPEPE
jgi:hypothetical protein